MKKLQPRKALPFLLVPVLAGVMAWYYDVFVNWNPAVFPFALAALVLAFLALAVSAVRPGPRKKRLYILGWLAAFLVVSQGVTFLVNNVIYNASGGARIAMRVALPLHAVLVILLLRGPWRALGRRAKAALAIPAIALACAGAVVWAVPLLAPPRPFEPIPDLPPAQAEKRSGSNGLSQDGASILIQNDLVTYVIAKENAVVTGIIDRADGADIIGRESPSPFCYFYTEDISSRVTPVSAALEEEKLRVAFADGAALDFLVEAMPGYLAFTLDSPVPGAYTGLVFADSVLDYDLDGGDSVFSGVGCAMTWNVDPTYYPDAKSKHVMGRVLNKTGPADRALRGSKFAVIYAPRNQHHNILKAVGGGIVPGEAAKSAVGGPYAMDSKANFGDYIIVGDSATRNIASLKSTAAAYGIDQIDFHQGAGTFVQGSMRFTVQKSAENFRKNVAQPLKEAGIQSGLHTYAHCVDTKDEAILTDPRWQQQLDVQETFTLREDVSRSAKTLPTVESTAEVSMKTGFFEYNTMYLLVDREIMKFTQTGASAFKVERGRCGTKKAPHAAGAEIRHLGGVFHMFVPDRDSELFLQIARRTAQAYNDGGFGMIYLDALDGLWCKPGEAQDAWYYSAKFTNEILKYCDTDPMMECSAMSPGFWISRSRMGAWDYPTAGYKEFNRAHVRANLEFEDAYLPTTLGWYHMYPSKDNTAGRFQYFDDIDHLGSLCVAYDMGMVYAPPPDRNSSEAYLRNAGRFADIYSPLRKNGYFSQEARARVRANPDKEYAIIETGHGQWAFVEKKYIKTKLYDVNAPERSTIIAENPFEAQRPFIRIEGHLSSGAAEGQVLLPLDFEKELTEQNLSAALEVNLEETRALRVNVTGNNSDDAVCIRLTSMSKDLGTPSIADYIIRLNYEGARQFVLAENDNGGFGDLAFPDKIDPFVYSYFREAFVFSNVTELQVYLSGACEGVRMSGIVATEHIGNAIQSPALSCGGTSVTFHTSIGENEYLEYFPGDTQATKYDGSGKAEAVAVTNTGAGLPAFPHGAFELGVAAENTYSAATPLRATVTLGFTGE